MSMFRNASTASFFALVALVLASALASSTAVVAVTCANQASQDPIEVEDLHIFLLMGQSNMAGFGLVKPGDDRPVPGVFVLGGECDKRSARPLTPIEWRLATHPLHNVLSTDGFGLGLSFAEAYVQRRSGVRVGLVPCAWGGTNIDGIGPGSPTWENAVARARVAKRAGTIKGHSLASGRIGHCRPRSCSRVCRQARSACCRCPRRFW